MKVIAIVLFSILAAEVASFLPRTTFIGKRTVLAAQAPNVDLIEAEDNSDPVVLRQPDTGKAIECYIHSLAKIEGDTAQYVVAVPADPCVDICLINPETDELTTIEEEDPEMDRLFPLASALLEEDDLFLVRSATTLTLQGDLELDEDDEDENNEEDFPEDTELASFESEGNEYCIIKVGMPLLMIGRAPNAEVGASEEGYFLLDDDQNDLVSSLIQEELDKQFDINVKLE